MCDLELGVRAEKEPGILVLLVELRISLHGNDEFKLPARRRFQSALELFGVPSKSLDNLGVFSIVEELMAFP